MKPSKGKKNLAAYTAVLFALLFVVACGSPPSQDTDKTNSIVCNKPYILVGTSCCLDKNDNSICDSDEAEGQTQIDSAPEPVAIALSAQDKLEATNFAQQLSRHWERNEWSEIYRNIPKEEKEVISEKEFVFFMNISSIYSMAQYDQEFQDSIYGGYYTGFKRGEGLKMVVGDVKFDNLTATTSMHSMSFDHVQLNVPIFNDDPGSIIAYGWKPFTFIREDGEWKVNTIGTYFMGNDYAVNCEATNYKYRCIFEYAKEFDAPEVCDDSGYFVSECYSHFKKPLDLNKAIAGCELQTENSDKDECLFRLMFTKRDLSVCEHMALKQDTFICYGIDAGFGKDIDACWDKISDTEYTTVNNQKTQCVYGYVWVTQNNRDCDKIPEKATNNLVMKCGNLDYPFVQVQG